MAELTASQLQVAKALEAANKSVKDLSNEKTAGNTMFVSNLGAELNAAGYPPKADMAKFDKVKVIVILTYLVILVTSVYGPIVAMLVEMFPTRIRYTSMSIPYHFGKAGSVVCCLQSLSRSWRKQATCTTVSGTPSSSRPLRL